MILQKGAAPGKKYQVVTNSVLSYYLVNKLKENITLRKIMSYPENHSIFKATENLCRIANIIIKPIDFYNDLLCCGNNQMPGDHISRHTEDFIRRHIINFTPKSHNPLGNIQPVFIMVLPQS